MRGRQRFLLTMATMLVAAASCAHSCGQPKNFDVTNHEPCTNFAPGAACVGVMGTICEVKNHPDPSCNEWHVCVRSGGTWKTRPPENANCPTACPATFTEASGPDAGPAASSSSSSLCEYPEGTCGPALLDGGAAGPWTCAKTTALRGSPDQCPTLRPAIGTPGCPDGLVCEYGYCKLRNATRLQCQENQWVLMDAFFLAGDEIDPGRCGE
jgi:hypothetical protein